MLWTLARRSAAAAATSSGASTVPPALDPILSRALQKLLPKNLPPSLVIKPGNLYEVLSRTPSGGVGTEVHQIRWNYKAIADSFWLVTRTRFKCEGKHGRAWGMLYWKGAPASLHAWEHTAEILYRQACVSPGRENTRFFEAHLDGRAIAADGNGQEESKGAQFGARSTNIP